MKKLLTIFMCLLAIGCGAKEKDADNENNKENTSVGKKESVSVLDKLNFSFQQNYVNVAMSDKIDIKFHMTDNGHIEPIATYEYDGELIEFAMLQNAWDTWDYGFNDPNLERYKGWIIGSDGAKFSAVMMTKDKNYYDEGYYFLSIQNNKNTPTTIDGDKFIRAVIDELTVTNIESPGSGLVVSKEVDLLGDGKLLLGPTNTVINDVGQEVPVSYIDYIEKKESTGCAEMVSAIRAAHGTDHRIKIQECYASEDLTLKEKVEERLISSWVYDSQVEYAGIKADAYQYWNNEDLYAYVIYSKRNTALILQVALPSANNKYRDIEEWSKEEKFQYMLEDHFIVKK